MKRTVDLNIVDEEYFYCPRCSASNIEIREEVEFDVKEYQMVVGFFCKECGYEWEDEFRG